jgi:hypothetical protein
MRKGALRALCFWAVVLGGSAASADVVEIEPLKDNTLYESATGSFSNGAGTRFFTGSTATGEARRGLVTFDVGANIPRGMLVTSVTLTLNVEMSISGAQTVALHRALADWGEGTSFAPSGQGGGTTPTVGDATWIHTFWPGDFWGDAGGDFDPQASGTQSVAGTGAYVWSSAGMVADVQGWVDDPASNFGWVVVSNEGALGTAKGFSSGEAPENVRPVLTVEFEPAPAVPGSSPWTLAVIAALLLALSTHVIRLRRRSASV